MYHVNKHIPQALVLHAHLTAQTDFRETKHVGLKMDLIQCTDTLSTKSPRFGNNAYEEAFDAEVYLEMYYGSLRSDIAAGDMIPFMLKSFHEVFNKVYFELGKITGKRFLDIGTGPSILSVISASEHCDSVYLSDFLPHCRRVLKEWVSGELTDKFNPFLEYVIDLEKSEESLTSRENKIRSKIDGILPCDLFKEEPLEPAYFRPFDVVTTSLCLEAICEDSSSYKTCVKRIASLVRQGGHVVVYAVLGDTTYFVGEEEFKSLHISKGEVEKVWTEAGFTITYCRDSVLPENERNKYCEFEAWYIMAARKQ
ncbi:indolethylamine N-methyltransferase-like isoform X1 [Haliotis rufescens]|uniref:indolethylamine N-methyltransferase-like isoform X1 n=1 Tax=Haliotis rufescens TaxID=6454 RepID=UPI001EB02C0F|nr:indolethylamine N-methyltransferase-like isoform X1 [Haliotis rufescens]